MKRAGVARVRTTARLLERVLVARQVRLSSGAGELRSVLSEQVGVVALLLLQNPLNARPYRVPLTACVCECLRVALRAGEEAHCSWFPLHARNAPSRLVYCTITSFISLFPTDPCSPARGRVPRLNIHFHLRVSAAV